MQIFLDDQQNMTVSRVDRIYEQYAIEKLIAHEASKNLAATAAAAAAAAAFAAAADADRRLFAACRFCINGSAASFPLQIGAAHGSAKARRHI